MKKTNQVFSFSFFIFKLLSGCENPIQNEVLKPIPSTSPQIVSPTPSAPRKVMPPTPNELPTPTPILIESPEDLRHACAACDKARIEGKIFDDKNKPLTGVTIKAKSLNQYVPFMDEFYSSDGNYAFYDIPTGFQVEIIATKPGYTTRKRTEVISSNKFVSDFRYDFGTVSSKYSLFSASYNALSDKPEVTRVTPARNGSDVSTTTSFRFRFSEPMDRQSVEDTFTIRSFNNRLLSVDGPHLLTINTLPIKYTFFGDGKQSSSSNQISNGSLIWDKSAFNIAWNTDDTEVTFTFKDEKALPTDKNKDLVPDYQVAFKSFKDENRSLKDKSGVERKEKHFKLTDGDFEESYKFSIKTDLSPPALISSRLTRLAHQPPSLLLQFSKPMLIPTHSLNIAGGMADEINSCKNAPAAYPGAKVCTSEQIAKNYWVKITGADGKLSYQGLWSDLGGEVSYASWDLTYKTVILSTKTLNPVFAMGSEIEITAASTITDPAGNALNSTTSKVTVK
jgi:hypothetical protein